ncbi:hypothetical protein D9M68_669790 [compost metagenome]
MHNQSFVGPRRNGPRLEVAAGGLAEQAANNGVDCHLLRAAVRQLAFGVIAHRVESRGGQGVVEGGLQGVLERRITPHQLVQRSSGAALGQLVAGEVANPFQRAEINVVDLVREWIGLGPEQFVEEA